MKIFYFFLAFIFLISYNAFSQINFSRDNTISVMENANSFKHAWVGGVNAMQPSKVDLNLDGINDLILFDRTGNKLTPFLDVNGEYVFAPEYRSAFSNNLHDWVIFADYNCDGKEDIFTYSSGGIAILENNSTSTLSFNMVTSLLLSDYGTTNINLYVSSVDIPAISDIDNDGDLDILTFSILGGFVEYHRNMAMELTGSCDTLAFRYEKSCWGNFFEGLNSYLINCTACSSDSCSPAYTSTANSKQKHSGSTLLAIDVDDDSDKDLILGDISYNNLNLLINGGDSSNANISAIDSVFPANNNNTLGVDLHLFPASFYLDVTHDGVKDLVVGTNSQANSENFESVWLYANSGTNSLPDFNFVSKSFLQEDMIDLGEGAYPVFFDYNNDSLMDLVVGNYGYHDVGGNDVSGLALFENVGTNNQPSYSLITRDFAGLSGISFNTNPNIPTYNFFPTFGDLNGDGNKDLIVGDADGKLHYFTNNGTTPSSFTLAVANYEHIDVGYIATPQLVDVNRDGLIDLLIGDRTGEISYFPNNGSPTTPVFDSIVSNFGGIDVDSAYISTGFSTPHFVDLDGEYHLYVGSFSGAIHHYDNIDGNLSGNFNLLSSAEQNILEGAKTSLCIQDINDDQIPDMIIGNYCGGLSYFIGDTLTTNINESYSFNNFLTYPNPTKEELFVQSKINGEIKIYSVLGVLMLQEEKITVNHRLNVNKLPAGIYILRLKNTSKKFVKE
ncbi:MAG: T9SS type A sorting domain-containing protein [Flavobacteriales bacterium]|nr:T9SS type A sorting domain-containing protein [Flavobacteriales bacterium]